MEMTTIQHARSLIKQGYGYKELPKMTGITLAQFYQLKREIHNQNFGCVVCCDKRFGKSKFCRRHARRYPVIKES